MQIDTTGLGKQLAAGFLEMLKQHGGKVKALASAEAGKLALALDQIAALLTSGEINLEEARVLVRIQQSASEAVLASLEEVSRVAAHKAVNQALRGAAGLVDSVIGVPLIGTALMMNL
jgi:ribosome maturation protein Sdo1